MSRLSGKQVKLLTSTTKRMNHPQLKLKPVANIDIFQGRVISGLCEKMDNEEVIFSYITKLLIFFQRSQNSAEGLLQ